MPHMNESRLQCVAGCCSGLQRVQVCCMSRMARCKERYCVYIRVMTLHCIVLKCVEVCWRVLKCVAAWCRVLRCVAACCFERCCIYMSQDVCAAVRCNVLQSVAVCCSVLQRAAAYCSALQSFDVCCILLLWEISHIHGSKYEALSMQLCLFQIWIRLYADLFMSCRFRWGFR